MYGKNLCVGPTILPGMGHEANTSHRTHAKYVLSIPLGPTARLCRACLSALNISPMSDLVQEIT